jgi:hypothetical protein
MKYACWTLIGLAVVSFAVGSYLTLMNSLYLMRPGGYWRGAMAFLLFAVAIRLMEDRK